MYNKIHAHTVASHADSTPFLMKNTRTPATAVYRTDVAIADKPTILGKVFFFNC
jgi:hypothetical protein